MRITPASRIYLLGATLCAALVICSRHFDDRGGPYFMASLAVAGIAYLLSVREFLNTAEFPRSVVTLGLLLAVVWHVAFLHLPAGVDDDIHRYVWDGRLQRLGYNPYIVVPSDPTAQGLHTPETRNLNNPDLTSPYPPGAQLFFRAVTAIRESTFAMKVAFVLCESVIAFVLLNVLHPARQTHLVLAYAWNPLLAIEVAGSGHVDIVGALCLVVSAAALRREWRTTAAVALGFAVAVKFLPIVLLPLYWKRVRIPDAALAMVLVVFLYVPFLHHGRIPIGSLGTYLQIFRFNGPVFAALAHVASPQLLAGVAVLVGWATAAWLRSSPLQWFPDQFAWPMAASLLCAPVIFPWYILWLLPFLSSFSTAPIIVWTVSIVPTYVVWHLRRLGYAFVLPGWVMVLEYGCVATAVATVLLRRFMRQEVAR